MNGKLSLAKRELKKIQKREAVYGRVNVSIVLNFTRPGKQERFVTLTTIRINKGIANNLYIT